MAQLISVKLSRFDGSPWGFRLQGGKDFGTPLIVQKVNNGSPAEAAGLRAGDAVIRVNSTDMFNLRHKDAQDVIVRAGNNFELTVQRGGSTWRPSVSPVTASIPSPQPTAPASSISPVTKTSLAAKKQDVHLIGSGHNFSPKPFLNGTSDGSVKSIVNKQYNSPVGIYSEETIAETLSAQAEVLAGGVLGVNFKKNEKNYNAQNSEVFKMVQEADKEPRTPEPAEPVSQSGVASPTSPAVAGLRSVQAPETKPQPSTPQGSLPPGQNICAECERLIVGVFVRIKEKNLHVECFKCSTCGTSLKNVGYYNINNKLYCDIHAKLVARQNAPAGMVPVTVGPGQKAPANTISAALSNVGPLSPALSNHGSSSPQPFSTSYARAYSPKTRHRNAYNNGFSSFSSIDNGYEQPRPESNNSYDNSNGSPIENGYESSKTYTSTLTIQTSQQQQQQQQNNVQETREKLQQSPELDYNRNPTNDQFNNLDNKLHKLTDDIRDFAFDEQKQQSKLLTGKDYCDANIVQKPMLLRAFKAPTNNLGGPKPFIGSSVSNQNYSSSPIINTGNSTLPRPQNQSVTETSVYRQDHCSRPQTFHEECSASYELVQEVCRPKAAEKPPNPRNSRPVWPPVKPIEDITYPTASPLYIDPNPSIDKRTRQVNRERRATVEQVISKRNHSYHESVDMEQASCPGPVYRRVELVNSRESRRCERSSSRASSTDSLRRSLTPTRITQPTPRPWTATVTSGTNLYQSAYAAPPDNICRSFCEKEVCQRESSCERQPGHKHREQHEHREEDTCRQEGELHRHEHKTRNVCKLICEPEPEPEPEPREEEQLDLSKLVPPDVAVCPKGIDAEHDLYTETEEEDKGNLHIKKTTTYEKTVELVSPDREMGAPFGQQHEQDRTELVREEYSQRCSTVDREVEDISGRRHVTGTSETLSKTIDTQQVCEEARRQEEEDRKRREEEARRQQQEEERKRQEEERLIDEMRRREEEQRRQKDEANRQRLAEEKRLMDEEEAERGKLCCNMEQRTEVLEERQYSCPRERIIDIQLEPPPCSQCSERPPSRERVIPIQMEKDEPPCKKEVRELKEEINIKQHCEHQDYEEQRRRSLREQVEVHQSLREQQSGKRQPTLQERRLSSRFSGGQQQQQQQQQCTKKHVQFVKQTESGLCPLPQTPVKNSMPKEWQSEMCKALTTAPECPYAPLQPVSNEQVQACSENREVYHREVTYEQSSICTKCQPKLPPPPNRPVSPFVAALTTASDRPYSPLGRQVEPSTCCRCRSQTPEMRNTYEGYSQPSQILYRNPPKEPPKKPEGPRPLPTPPPDFRFRNRSASRSPCRSRSQTPCSGRVSTPSACGLKRPDTIPSYQKHLVCEEQAPVQGHEYPEGRTSTPCCHKSPAPGPPEPPSCFTIKAQAPRIKDEEPPCRRQRDTTTPDKTETTRYHYEEDTPQCHKTKDTVSSKTVSWVGEGSSRHAHLQEHEDTVSEECDGSHHVKRMEHRLKEYDDPEQPSESPVEEDTCYISQNCNTQPCLPCPAVQQNSVMDRIQKTGVRVFAPMGTPEVKRIKHEVPPPSPKPPCPMTGLTVLPVRAHGDVTCKDGVVVVPCDGIGSRGVCITPTPDRSGVNVSPCPAESGRICQKPKCYCGSTSDSCTTNLGNVETTRTVYATPPCAGIPGVRSVQCPKPNKCLGAAKANLPFPQIPLPEEDPEPPCKGCPLAGDCVTTTTTTTSFSSSSDGRDCGFQPIHKPREQPRTNLCNQITTLTLCKRESKPQPAAPPKVPVVQLYKPQPPAPPCRSSSSSQQVKQTVQSQNRFRRETQTTTTCQSQSRTQSQTSCSLSSKTQSSVDPPNMSSLPDLGAGSCGLGGGNKAGTFAGSSAPNRGRGILNQAGSGLRVPLCAACNSQVRGPFISALGQIWCPEHFVCVNPQCRRGLQDIGFVEEKGQLYCEYCFERFIAPSCNKCNNKIKGDCLNAIGKHFHPECFNCAHCGKHFGNSPFFLEEGLPYCERDWNDLFTTKCFACGFPVEAGDRWVEALNNNYHSQCFNCTMCKKNLEGQSFYAKGGRPFCKNHAR